MGDQHFNESEYGALREELLKRIELRQTLVSIVVTSAGVLLGFSIKTAELAYLFPPLSLFLCLMWAQNDIRALQITDYLHTLENDRTRLGWTTFYKSKQGKGSILTGVPFSVMAPGGIFILTALMALGIAISKWPSSNLYIWLLVSDIISILLMTWLVLYVSRARLIRRNLPKND